MKAIDLLNKIANGGPIPYRIKYNENIYYYDLDLKWYIREDLKNELFIDRHHLRDNIEIINNLEILDVKTIEEPEKHKIPEKIKIDNEDRIQALSTGNFVYKVNQPTKNIIYKVNEIIDYLEEIEQ